MRTIRHPRVMLAVLAVLAFAAFAMAQETAPKEIAPELKQKIERLVKQLGAEDFKDRDDAGKALEEIGAPTEPFLKQALDNPDPEVKLLASQILRAIALKRNGRIVFVKRGNSELLLCAMDPDGRNQGVLFTNNGKQVSYERRPQWSPNRKAIAFMVGDDLHVIDTDGKNEKKLADGLGEGHPPSWSPDGKRLAIAKMPPFKNGIFVLDLAAKTETDLIPKGGKLFPDDGPNTCPCWSPDGKRIAFVHMQARGVHPVPGDFWHDSVCIVDADGTNMSKVLDTCDGPDNHVGGIRWSPDGRTIAFAAVKANDEPPWLDIFTVDIKSGKEARLTQHNGAAVFPSWSPDGTMIVFVKAADGGRGGNTCGDIWTMDADGKNQVKLTDDGANWVPSW